MIASLAGRLKEKKPAEIIIDVGGVGYHLFITLTTFYDLPEVAAVVSLDVYTVVREDAIHLYGFSKRGEKELFKQLIGVNKVGPKLAVTILSGVPVAELVAAVATQDTDRLLAVPGIGKKTAQRLIIDLADKIGGLEQAETSPTAGGSMGAREDHKDAVEALINLGYKKTEAEKAVNKASKNSPDADLESLLKESLKSMA